MTYDDSDCGARRERAEAARPVTLRETIDTIPRTVGHAGDLESFPVVRQGGQVFGDELDAAEKHDGRKLLAGERHLLDPFIGA